MKKLLHLGNCPYISSLMADSNFGDINAIRSVYTYLQCRDITAIDPVIITYKLLNQHQDAINDFEKSPQDTYLKIFRDAITNSATSLILLPNWKQYKTTYGDEFLTAVKKKIYVFSIDIEKIKANESIQTVLTYEYAPPPQPTF